MDSKNNIHSVWALINEAQQMFNLGDRAGAQSLLEQGLEQVDKSNYRRVLALLSQLGYFLVRQRKYAQAVPVLRDAVRICDLLPVERAAKESRSVMLDRLGECLMFVQRYPEAEQVLRKAVDFSKEFLGVHRITSLRIIDLATCLGRQGKHAEAETYWEEAVQMTSKPSVHGDKPMIPVQRMGDLADCLSAQGKHAKAQEVLERALQINKGRGPLDYNGETAQRLRSHLVRCRAAQGK